jgi:hypothetical protein
MPHPLRVDVLELLCRIGHVLGDIDDHWTGTTGGRDVEGLLDRLGNLLGSITTMKLCFTIGRDMPNMSVSWKASSPIFSRGTCPEITTIGIESM